MALALWKAVVLGAIQGVTEWLPVSSDGHLVVAQILLDAQVPVFFDAVLHLATLLVLIVFFRATIAKIIQSLVAIPTARKAGEGWPSIFLEDPDRRIATFVVIATIPTAIAGFLLLGPIEALYKSAMAAGLGLIFTGAVLWWSRSYEMSAQRPPGWRDALVMGAAQGAAILPGVSRSGCTIGAALIRGVQRDEAARLSFLMAAPAILGAFILKADAMALAAAAADLTAYTAGAVTAAVVGYAALALLVFIIRRGGFHHFAWYCWTVGVAVVGWALAGAPSV